MPLVNFAIQGNGEESEGGSQMSETPGLQIMAPHNQVRTSPASKEDKHLMASWGGGGRAGTPELFCRSQVVLAVPGLSQHWHIPLDFWLWTQGLCLLPAWTEVSCQAVLEAKRAVLVLCELNRILESAWLHWELTLPVLQTTWSLLPRTVLLFE